MELHERERLLARISSGSLRVKINGRFYFVKQPTREQQYVGQEIFQEQLEEAMEFGALTSEELVKFLVSQKKWTKQDQETLDKLPKNIDTLKIALYRAAYKAGERQALRNMLAISKSEMQKLQTLRGQYEHFSCSAAAIMSRMTHWVACSLCDATGKRVFNDDILSGPSDLVEPAMSAVALARISEHEYRELARTEPWRSTWSCSKSEKKVFGCSATDLTEEQKNLICWSGLYESVYQNPNCPTDDVIADDDMFDGWLLIQREERDNLNKKNAIDARLGNEKIRNASEVYVFSDNFEDARNIMDMNDEGAKRVIRQRYAAIEKKGGVVNDLDLPDVKQSLEMAVTKKMFGT
jgi:hypothetical protein